ncbi:MAG: toxin-antitoxin system antitoxin subunit [Campylobacterota bacterium]|nr:toxin-antitoxin system antitoxin subunit [Campylobacterota bacterium]
MGHKTVVYKQKVKNNLEESFKHLQRLKGAFCELEKEFIFPIDSDCYKTIINNVQYLAYSDQLIYRFSKLQDCMGAKLFKSILLYQGENIDKPFLDILNNLEKMDIIDVDEWFELRDLRNEIAHDYEDNDKMAINIINTIHSLQSELEKILNSVQNILNRSSEN